jgi:hypothetical protein
MLENHAYDGIDYQGTSNTHLTSLPSILINGTWDLGGRPI